MQSNKHKRKTNHVVIVTSDAVDGNVKQFRIRPWMRQAAIIVVCFLIGAVAGYVIYGGKMREAFEQESEEQLAAMKTLQGEKTGLKQDMEELEEGNRQLEENNRGLEEDNKGLEEQIKNLEAQLQEADNKIKILSETVNQKTENENQLTAQLEKQYMPTEFPLTGSASMEEGTEGEPICIFTASEGTTVVATASGTVTAVNSDVEYGNNVWIDHGNGYITIYRNKGDATVKQGDDVVQGTTLFIIEEENTKLGYQMMKDGVYITPMELLTING